MILGSRTNVAWLAAYLTTMASIVLGLQHYRHRAIATYGTAQATDDWHNWKEAAQKIAKEGPVYRRPPKSTEPPALVLMRDHFPACLGISLLLSSCLFAWFMICVRGAMRPATLNHDGSAEQSWDLDPSNEP